MKLSWLTLTCVFVYLLCAGLYFGSHNYVLAVIWLVGAGFQSATLYYQRKTENLQRKP